MAEPGRPLILSDLELDATPSGQRRALRRCTYQELVDQGVVAPHDDSYRYFDQDNKRRGKPGRPEESSADWLYDHGVVVRSVDHVPTGAAAARLPDAVIDTLRRTIEVKTIKGRTPRTIEEAIRRSVGQCDTILVDARATELKIADVEAGMRDAIRKNGVSIAEVIVVMADGNHITWRHG